MTEKLASVIEALEKTREKLIPKTAAESQAESVGSPCLNCGAVLVGSFCHECGQSAGTKRYSVANFAQEIYQSFRTIDLTASIRTGWRLIVDPGNFVRGYLAGQRVGFINPVKFFFYTFVIEIAIHSALRWVHSDMVDGEVRSDRFYQFIDLASTMFWGVLWFLFYRSSGFNLAESSAAAIFYQSALNFLQAILLVFEAPLMYLLPESKIIPEIIAFVPAIIYAYYFVFRLYQESIWVTIIKQTILTILFALMLVIAGLLLLLGKTAMTLHPS